MNVKFGGSICFLFQNLRVRVESAFLLIAVAMTSAVTHAQSAADFFGGIYADDTSHSVRTIESNADHRDLVWIDMRQRMSHYSSNTQIGMWETAGSQSWVDVRWWATDASNFGDPDNLASAVCRTRATGAANRCDAADIRINEDNYFDRTDLQQDHTICHELAHTLGSDDGLTLAVGCFPQSRFSTERFLTDDEEDVIDNHDF